MCGFAGFLCPARRPEELRAAALRMAATLQHRGPDDEGVWVDPRGEVALGFRRLAILDLTVEGHQPMLSSDGRYAVAFNGEVYNFAGLRRELEAFGHHFRGRSDTEVLLAAVMQWGLSEALTRLYGMFAIALWDSHFRRLHLARDRVGKKPLYYGWQGATLLFGSELKALRAHTAFEAPLDRESLVSFLRFSYVPAPHSIYRGIFKLLPGSYVTFSLEERGRLPEVVRYWDALKVARAAEARPLHASDEDATDALERVLMEAVRVRTVADVPLGAFLSGGIDSSTVVALLQAQSTSRVRTFTIGYASPEYDESAHARAVALHLGTDHTELQVAPEEARAVIPSLPGLYDEPFADASQIPTSLVARLARTKVTVALSGDGGDELFGGYNRYVSGIRLWRMLGAFPGPLRRGLARALEGISPRSWDRAGNAINPVLGPRRRGLITGNRVHKLATVLGVRDLREMYLRLTSTWPKPGSLVAGWNGPERSLPRWEVASSLEEPEHQMMLLDLVSYLPDDILVKVDRATMGVSLEARAPLLDHRVIEFAWRLPITQKIRGGQGKWILRHVLDRHLPRTMLERPKQGFGIPIDSWLRGPLRAWALDLLSEARLRREGFFEPTPIQRALREHLEGRANRQYQLWAVLMFQAWLDAQAGAVCAS